MIEPIRAWPLPARAATGAALMLLLVLLAGRMLIGLGEARAHGMAIRRIIAEPPPVGLRPAVRHRIAEELRGRIRGASVRTGVLVERLSVETPSGRDRPVETATLVASGSERHRPPAWQSS